MEVTLELSCCKFPPAAELQVILVTLTLGTILNVMALYWFWCLLSKIFYFPGLLGGQQEVLVEVPWRVPPGSEGLCQGWELCTYWGSLDEGDIKTMPFQPHICHFPKVRGRDVGFQTTKEGEFWRILLPGIYTMEVFAEGFAPREVQFAIVEQNPTMLNVTLYPVRFFLSFILNLLNS